LTPWGCNRAEAIPSHLFNQGLSDELEGGTSELAELFTIAGLCISVPLNPPD
jgi:hypothetical protein